MDALAESLIMLCATFGIVGLGVLASIALS